MLLGLGVLALLPVRVTPYFISNTSHVFSHRVPSSCCGTVELTACDRISCSFMANGVWRISACWDYFCFSSRTSYEVGLKW